MTQREATQPMLSIEGISKHYGGIRALSDVSLDVRLGEVLALVGDNGAGKSTLVKVLSGIVSHDSGRIQIDNREVQLDKPQDATDLGVQTVYQDLALCDNLDTIQNLFLGREKRASWLRGRRLQRPEMEATARKALLALNVKIRDYHTPVGSLSGGQRQSIAVARAVLSEPRIVILDEPTAALGVPQRAEVLDLIGRLRDQNIGVILISHDLKDVLDVADRIVVLRLGHKVAEFTRENVTRDALVAQITGVGVDNPTQEDQEQPS